MQGYATRLHRPPLSGRRRFALDAILMSIYLVVCYAWTLDIYPMGRDYAILTNPSSVGPVFVGMVHCFGAWIPGYHLVNLAVLFVCMLAIYRIVKATVRGPFWLGTLAAVLFMANPVHTEAVANLCGTADLVPALQGLISIALYVRFVAANGEKAERRKGLAALLIFTIAVTRHACNRGLILAPLLYECLILETSGDDPTRRRRLTRLIPFGAIALLSITLDPTILSAANFNPVSSFAPLYFLFYPVGLLPENARLFHEYPAFGWVAAWTVLAALILIQRKARDPAVGFGLLSAAALRLFQGGNAIDPVHLIGGGRLLLPNALYCVALVALFHRIMDHPKWVRPTITLTTLLAVFFFSLQIAAVLRWRQAAREVRRFQQAAERLNEPFAVLPDFRYWRGAPLCLSEAVALDTLFSKKEPAIPVLPLNYDRTSKVSIESWSAHGGVVRIEGKKPEDLLPTISFPDTPGCVTSIVESSPTSIAIEIRACPGASLPVRALSLPIESAQASNAQSP